EASSISRKRPARARGFDFKTRVALRAAGGASPGRGHPPPPPLKPSALLLASDGLLVGHLRFQKTVGARPSRGEREAWLDPTLAASSALAGLLIHKTF
ncbi:hypothetical protein E2320_006890, partial [Naja naja]